MIEKQRILDFIASQPDDRKIDWSQPNSTYNCGCLMVHFGREELGLPIFCCSTDEIYPSKGGTLQLDMPLYPSSRLNDTIPTYGELKSFLERK